MVRHHRTKNTQGGEPDDIDNTLGTIPEGADGTPASQDNIAGSGNETTVAIESGQTETDQYGPFTPAVNFLADLRDKYQEQLAAEPLKTKVITSCFISMLGEVVGSYIKNRRHTASAAARGPRGALATQPPSILDPKRIALFGVYGLAITGPMFHWWYAFLDRTVRRWNLAGNTNLLVKIAMDRLLMTPPFLLITLVYLNYFQSFNPTQVSRTVKNIYAGALYLNWRVWTVAQAVNFKYVPLEYRVLFGNVVALWWNIVLSLRN